MKQPTINNEELLEAYQICVNLKKEISEVKLSLYNKKKEYKAARSYYRKLYKSITPPSKTRLFWRNIKLSFYEGLQTKADKIRKQLHNEEANLINNMQDVIEVLKSKAILNEIDKIACQEGMKVLQKLNSKKARHLETQLQGMLT